METRTIDADGRINLPPEFANTTVFIDRVSESEIRIRRAEGPAANIRFIEEEPRASLGDRDRDRFLELIENAPPPNEALKAAFDGYRRRHG